MIIEEKMAQLVFKKAMSKVDLDKIASKLAPLIEQRFQKDIMQALSDFDWNDVLDNALDTEQIEKSVRKIILEKINQP